MPPPFIAFESRDALMHAAADRIATALKNGIATRGAACAALSGGSTPAPAYEKLSECDVDWTRATFALVDERLAPPTSGDSNQGLLVRTLGGPLSKGAKIAPMWSENTNLSAAADRANTAYNALNIDIAVLGMGADGHTASWFPDADRIRDALDPTNPRTVMTLHAESAAGTKDRLTLTASALSRVGRALLLITGDDKRARYEASLLSVGPSPIGALVAACGGRLEVLWCS